VTAFQPQNDLFFLCRKVLLLNLLHVLSPGTGHLAGFVFEEIFQVKETDRIERTARGGSDIFSLDDFNLLIDN
jgi:hypothetical protein